MFIHPVSEFIDTTDVSFNVACDYWYEGYSCATGELVRLPRTDYVKAIACGLMKQLKQYEGKMYGVLLIETPLGELGVLKAFSGLLEGNVQGDGWVPPISVQEQIVVDETYTLTRLENIKLELLFLENIPERQQYKKWQEIFAQRLEELAFINSQRQAQREKKRQYLWETLSEAPLEKALEMLKEESRQDGMAKRNLKRERDKVLLPLKEVIDEADKKITELKQTRKRLSRQLQTIMYASYSLFNFSGESKTLQQLMREKFLPTGTGECCAPKLLNYAATHNLKPLAMAEFWWGYSSNNGAKQQGEFYEACAERCQPLMGFLLSGISPEKSFKSINEPLTLLYEDEGLIVVKKPAGLLSVPGRSIHRSDSVLSRLCVMYPDGINYKAVHRLDQETSGLLAIARNVETHRHVSQQFQKRQVIKVYEAILNGVVKLKKGVIDLPLWGDPQNRPYQTVDWEKGKASITNFQVIHTEGEYTRVEFMPLTGRTHQLRVHAASCQGLGLAILGDRLYGVNINVNRLHLHAREISFQHPQSGNIISLAAKTPF